MKLSDLSKSQLGSVQERFAVASDVYEDKNPAHQLAGGWQKVFKSSEVPGLEDRGFGGALYKRTIGGEDQFLIAFRGMDGLKDLDDVALLALGKPPEQLTEAYKFTKIASEKFGFAPSAAEYVGHSMGGYLSKAIGMLHGSLNVTAFNSPGLFHEDLKGLPQRIREEFGENKSDITLRQIEGGILSINSKFDPVTWIGEISGNTIKVNTSGNQHKLHSLYNSFNRAAEGIHAPQATPISGVAFGRNFTLNGMAIPA